MRKVALVDLDSTIFDTKKFREECFVFLEQFVPPRVVRRAYEEAKKGGFFDADLYHWHLDLFVSVAMATRIDTESLVKDWLSKVGMEKFLFPDTELFLRLLAQHGYEVHILTLGTEWFQKAKIEGAGLLELLSGYTVTRYPKVSAILTICNPAVDDVLFFDDHLGTIDSVKQAFPKIFSVQVLRYDEQEEKRSALADSVVNNLEEAMGTLLAHQKPL